MEAYTHHFVARFPSRQLYLQEPAEKATAVQFIAENHANYLKRTMIFRVCGEK